MKTIETYSSHTTEIIESPKSKQRKMRKFGVIALSAGVASGIYAGAAMDAMSGPTYSEATQPWTAQPGEGLIDAAYDVEGIDDVDYRDVATHIESMNQEALEDGLQEYETLEIPVSVDN